MTVLDRYMLTELERATGIVIGPDRNAPDLPPPPRAMTTRDALADSIRTALRRPPCLVSFSGGRDSSAVLAVAADIARKERLPAPVAMTHRYPRDMASTDESHWQELVIAHARIEDWIRVDVTDEMDCLGPIGLETLKRHGLIYPIAPHSLVPALRLCGGGSLLTGIGGDEVFGRRSRIADLLAGRVKPIPRDAARIAIAVGPRSIRRAFYRRRAPAFVAWLTPKGRTAFERSWGEAVAAIPVGWGRGVLQSWRSRGLQIALAGMDLLAREHDVQLQHPHCSPLFISVLAREAGMRGYADRTEVMRMLFEGVLPEEINSRRTKAVFGEPYWTHYSQEFGRSWNGEGVDPELVDVDSLRGLWADPKPPPAPTMVLLKQAWMASRGIAQQFESVSARQPPALAS